MYVCMYVCIEIYTLQIYITSDNLIRELSKPDYRTNLTFGLY